jgi:SAM-dependent methyltransferase
MKKQLGLNLGCGRVQFPIHPDDRIAYHIIGFVKQYCQEALLGFNDAIDWINIDHAHIPGVDEVLDLFAYPWIRSSNGLPFEDNSIDVIWCSHVAEHIPHIPRWNKCPRIIDGNVLCFLQGLHEFNRVMNYLRPHDVITRNVDGWFIFFSEVWRILKPTGIIHLAVPYAFSVSAVGDPTHTRYIIPETFAYFAPSGTNPFDYKAPRFEATNDAEVRLMSGSQERYEHLEKLRKEWSENKEDVAKKIETDKAYDDLIEYTKHQINVIEELCLSMRPVK